jgi:hypothetical protein
MTNILFNTLPYGQGILILLGIFIVYFNGKMEFHDFLYLFHLIVLSPYYINICLKKILIKYITFFKNSQK